ncbi:hypothetical protein [Fredinandcohnia sp. 179-A 10B2 NHS]|uniref:hypothetical protein n=1 Tax=Fredinandcohnia sp. 179-A 10B2 NHS TaxID=3235176 RepID=UPI0039A1C6B7
MDKKRILQIVLGCSLLVGGLFFKLLTTTTYEELLATLIEEDEKVEQVEVHTKLGLIKKTASATISDPVMIDKLIDAQIKLRKEITVYNNPPILDNVLLIKTNKDTYEIGFDEESMTINNKRYFTETAMDLYMNILIEDFSWEISQ